MRHRSLLPFMLATVVALSDARALVESPSQSTRWPTVASVGTSENRAPNAQAGTDQTLLCQSGTPVATQLDGSASTDADSTPGTNDDIVAFDWFEQFGTASQSALGSGALLSTSFAGGTHQVTLRVTDRQNATGVATLNIVVQPAASCDDGNPCTADSVTPACECKHVTTWYAPCDDGNPCTAPDFCEGRTCAGEIGPNGTACDDGNLCTKGDGCFQGSCAGSVPFVFAPGSPILGPKLLGTGDFDRDGTPDLVVSPSGGNSTIRLLLGDGSGGFTQGSSAQFAGGSYPPLVAVADFNLDGRLDIAAVQYDSPASAVVVFLGNGAGGLVQAAGPATPDGAYRKAFAAGDFNNDHKPDLVSVSLFTETATIFLGDGNGGFVARTPIAAGDSPHALATGDFNRDGHLDLAVASASMNGGVLILLGDGTGGLAPFPGSTYLVEYGPSSIAVGDFDLDGTQDLAVGSGSSSTALLILRGAGDGTFGTARPLAFSEVVNSVAVADLDLDGRLDLIVGTFYTGGTRVLLGTGTIDGFTPAFDGEADVSGNKVNVATGDFDQDGQIDVVAATSGPYEVSVLLNRSKEAACPGNDGCMIGVCDRVTGACDSVPKFAGSACDDHDGCTTNDVCAGGVCTGDGVTCTAVDVCRRPGTCDPAVGCTDLNAPDGTACSDADACTRVDACVSGDCIGQDPVTCADQGLCKVGVCNPATGACGLASRPEQTPCDDGDACTGNDACHAGVCVPGLSFSSSGSPISTGGGLSAIALADLNRDGHQDLAVLSQSANTVELFAGDSAGGFTPMGTPIAVPRRPTSIAAADFNLDGVPDLAITSDTSSTFGYISVLLGGAGGYVSAPGSPFTVAKTPASIVAGDFNLDGKPDLVMGSGSSPFAARLFLGDGAGRLVLQTQLYTVSRPNIRLVVADFDLDGKPDLAIACGAPNGALRIFFGFAMDGTGTRTATPWGGGSTLLAGDLNGDGRPDLVCAGESNYSVLLADAATNFAPVPGSPFAGETSIAVSALVDFNLDGKLDLLTSASAKGYVRARLGDGTGHFNEVASSPIAGLGDVIGVVSGDFNEDGKPDFASASNAGSKISIQLGSPAWSAKGTACSDGNACTVDDVCDTGACRGTAGAPPSEVEGVLLDGHAEATLTWTPVNGGGTYDIAAAALSALGAYGTATAQCVSNDLAGTSFVEASTPISNEGLYYLIRAQSACGAGSYGHNSTGAERLPAAACP